jgi:predicted RNA-binding protein associated with RNAse of E/G family
VARNRGSTVDTATERVRDRDGLWYPLDRLVIADRAVYYARPIDYPGHITYHERWLLAEQGWSLSRFVFTADAPYTIDWYIEPDIIEIEGHRWHVHDGYVDLEVHDGQRYRLDDADELADGLAAGEISLPEACEVLRALDRVCDALRDHDCSGAEILARYAPGLPG